MIQTPSVKCSRFEIVKSATIAEKPACPYASTASGSPMLPQLLNIIGGTNVRLSSCRSRANGHARSPEPTTTPMLPRISSRFAARSKSLPASAVKMSAGASTVMLSRLTHAMSGFVRRAQAQPSAITRNTGTMMPRMRSITLGARGLQRM